MMTKLGSLLECLWVYRHCQREFIFFGNRERMLVTNRFVKFRLLLSDVGRLDILLRGENSLDVLLWLYLVEMDTDTH